MKHIKMLALAAVAALGLLAVAGAATASASATLCSTNTTPCTGTIYKKSTKISSSLKAGTVATLTASTTVTCKKSTVGGVTTTDTGHGEINAFTFSECHTTSGQACTVKAVNLNYTATATTGALDITPLAGKGNPGALVECGAFINCTFTVNSITLSVIGGSPATIVAKDEKLNGSGFLCPSEAKWDAEYTVSSPNPLFLI